VGDSNVSRTDWHEYFDGKVCNYGIVGSTSHDVFLRRKRVARLNPDKIVLLAGGNDLFRYIEIKDIAEQYRKILSYYKTFCPDIYCISNLPVMKKIYINNWAIILLNVYLENVCNELGVTYVNVYPFLYSRGGLNPKYAADKVHLNTSGQKVLAFILKKQMPGKKNIGNRR